MDLIDKFLNRDFSKLRLEICNIIKYAVIYINKIEEKMVCSTMSEEISDFTNKYNSEESNLEKALFFLSMVYPYYRNSNIDSKEFYSLAYSLYDIFKSKKISKIIKHNGFSNNTEFLNNRINFYSVQLDLLKTMENPHSGNITYYWYVNPLSKTSGADKNIFVMAFFFRIIWPEYFNLFLNSIENLINKQNNIN